MSETQRQIARIRSSHLFDPEWYLSTYPDVRQSGMDPALHYYRYGAGEFRDPGPAFETKRYLQSFPAAASTNPLLHCIDNGNDRFVLSRASAARDPATQKVGTASKPDALAAWQIYNAPTNRRAQILQQALNEEGKPLPTFSIVMPVYNPPLYALREAIESVRNQTYAGWELLISDDRSTDRAVIRYLKSLKGTDSRIKIKFRSSNGHISAATNGASLMASNDYITFLDNDDKIAKDSLAILAIYLSRNRGAGVFYSDDAVLSDGANYKAAKFKPQWSPELLLSFCYMSHLKGMKLELYREVGGCRLGYEGSQDHDLFLRATEQASSVLHIPHVLYERRPVPGSTAVSGNAKPYSFDAGIRAVRDAFFRRNSPCDVRRPDWAIRGGLGIYEPVFPDEGPSVAIIIPTFNSAPLLARLVESLKLTAYRNYRVYIADNGSTDEGALQLLSRLATEFAVKRIEKKGGRFNFAHINNEMVRSVTEELVLFLNDDTEITNGNWLSQMVGWAKLQGVGAVGARLLFDNGRIQHGGVSIAARQSEGLTLFRGYPADRGAYVDPRVARNVVAVTAACMLTRRSLFVEIGGFDEGNFGVAYNDVDYCLRLMEAGYRCVYAGEVELLHHEGTTRGKRDNIREIAAMREKLRYRHDPYVNPQLQISSGLFYVKPTVVPLAPDAPLSLLAFTHNLNHEGAPNSQAEVVIGLAQSRAADAVVVSPSDGPLRKKYEAAGIRVRILDQHPLRQGQLLAPGSLLQRLRDEIERLEISNFDVVYANTAQTFWAVQLAKIANVPSVWNIRESENWQSYYKNFSDEMQEFALGTFSIPYRVVFVADSTMRAWSPLDRMGNFTVISNALPKGGTSVSADPECRRKARQVLGIEPAQVLILNVGTICDRKNQMELVKAVDMLPAAQRKRCVVYLVGGRPSAYLDALHGLLQGKRWKDQVRIVSETGDTAPYWHAADIFCFTSKLESYPRVILEAMTANLPIVTSPVFGVSEQVRDGENAIFYESGDIEGLSRQLATLISDPDLRARMGEASHSVLKTLSTYDEVVSGYSSIFRAARESSVPRR